VNTSEEKLKIDELTFISLRGDKILRLNITLLEVPTKAFNLIDQLFNKISVE